MFLHGDVFVDLVFTGLPSAPQPGTEIFAERMGMLPGGIATLAVACARLGLRTALAAGFGDDAYGAWIRTALAEEGVDLGRSRVVPQPSNVTVCLGYDGDRAMVTRGYDLPIAADELIGQPPSARAVITDLGADRGAHTWWRAAAAEGADVYADIGWDATGAWDRARLEPLRECAAFTPNETEAIRYTGAADAHEALEKLIEIVPFAVITRGPNGAIARDRRTGETAESSGIAVAHMDPTGAGDVFTAALVYARLQEWPLQRVLDFAVLCASLSVTEIGGAFAAPGWLELSDWFVNADDDLFKRYSFIPSVIPPTEHAPVRRAAETF